VQPVDALNIEEIDGLVVATFERPEAHLRALERQGVPAAKCVTLRRLAPAAGVR
jgi:hypothetical protein